MGGFLPVPVGPLAEVVALLRKVHFDHFPGFALLQGAGGVFLGQLLRQGGRFQQIYRVEGPDGQTARLLLNAQHGAGAQAASDPVARLIPHKHHPQRPALPVQIGGQTPHPVPVEFPAFHPGIALVVLYIRQPVGGVAVQCHGSFLRFLRGARCVFPKTAKKVIP